MKTDVTASKPSRMKTKHLKSSLQSLLVLIVYLPFLAATSPRDQSGGPAPESSARINDFAFDLLKREAAAGGGQNTLISPFSIYSSMAMSYIASGGPTRLGLARALHFPADNDSLVRDLADLRRKMAGDGDRPGVELRMAGSVWLDTTWAKWQPDYLRTLDRMGAQPARDAKFADKTASCAEINRWISAATHGRIAGGITPADIPSRSKPALDIIDEPGLVTVDAAWFKAKWAHQFDATETMHRLFNRPGGGSADIPMMHQDSLFPYSQNPHWQLLVMPYLGGRFSMLVLLPRDIEDAKAITASLTQETMKQLLAYVHPAKVDILFPKFTLRRHTDLDDTLIALGAADAFNKNKANFDAMIIKQETARHVYLSSVKQDTWMQVSEEGTEAAAATTAVYFTLGCSAQEPPETVNFHADHPFLFFIVHNPSRAILFAGWVTNPAALDSGE